MAVVGVCEDDPSIRRVVGAMLRRYDHTVVMAHTGAEAVRLFGHDPAIDVVVLDIGLPDSDGRDVCQALRVAGQHAPVLFLTALDAPHELLSGFHAGGDDYLTKPFQVAELAVRVDALARRHRASVAPAPGLRLDPQRFAVLFAEREAALTPTEYRMLAALAGKPGEVVRRRALAAAAWPDGAVVNENTIDSYIRRLRRKLADVDPTAAIETVRGVGYVLR
ncbi:MAG TPA: response regulator transcription factor [Nocardioidaceae bacterium]|nr:response regulator transcription factor [Nocardioidaceae bacterium]